MPVPARKKGDKTQDTKPDTELKSLETKGGDAEAVVNDATDETVAQTLPPVEVKPAVIPMKDRVQLPEILYVKTTYPRGAIIGHVHMPIKSGFMSNDRYLSRQLLDQGIEMVESFSECDIYHS